MCTVDLDNQTDCQSSCSNLVIAQPEMTKGSLSRQLHLVRTYLPKIAKFLLSEVVKKRKPFIISCPQEQLRNSTLIPQTVSIIFRVR